MTSTTTKTSTYTKADVTKTFESFRSNLRLIRMSSGCALDVDLWANDVLVLAASGYLEAVNVILSTSSGERIRAAKFTVSEDAAGWSSELPDDNIWPPTPNGALNLIVEYSAAWLELTSAQQAAYRQGTLKGKWHPTDADVTYNDMTNSGARRYSSNAFGLRHSSYSKVSGS